MIQSYVVTADKDNGEETHKRYRKLRTAIIATRFLVKSKLYSDVELYEVLYQSEKKLKQNMPYRSEMIWSFATNTVDKLNELSQKEGKGDSFDGVVE